MTLAFALVIMGTTACKKGEQEAVEEQGLQLEEGQLAFEGTVKFVVGKYVFIPEVRGFDIYIQGSLTSGEINELEGKVLKGVGEFVPENPSLLLANTLEMQDEAGEWQPIFERTEEPVFEDYLGIRDREDFEMLEELSYREKEGWEGKERVKIQGKLEGQEGDYRIVLEDERGNETGRIIIDGFTDFGEYYHKKLRLFDEFVFYLMVKETVDWQSRRRTREMFHADVLFAGLF
jgi:hypothetical protein